MRRSLKAAREVAYEDARTRRQKWMGSNLIKKNLRRKIGYRSAIVDGLAFGCFCRRFLLGQRQHLGGAAARDETHAGVVGEHDIAWGHAHAVNDHFAVDLDRFDAPLAGNRSEL